MTRLLLAGALVAAAFATPAAHADPPVCTIRGCVEQLCADYGITDCPL